MERSRSAETSSPPPDTRPLDWTGFLLLALFSIWSLLAILPLQLFSPVWAHQLVVTLVNNAPLLLIGVALLRLAIAWGAGAPAVQAWRLRVCRLAALAAVVYLLMIPLDLVSTWRQVQGLQLQAQSRQRAMDRLEQQALQAIDQAADGASLASRLRQLQGPQLTSTDLAQPLPDLKLQLRASLASNFAALRNQAAGPRAETLFAMGRESLRLVLSALVCALGLSALSWNGNTQRSQLQAIADGLARMRQRNQALRKATKRSQLQAIADGLAGMRRRNWMRQRHQALSKAINPQTQAPRPRNGRWGFGRDQGSEDYINEILREQERDQP